MSESQNKYFNEKDHVCKSKPFLMAHSGQQQQWLKLVLAQGCRAKTTSPIMIASLR